MIGFRIQRARKAQGLSLRALAEQVGLSHSAIKKLEDNIQIPSSSLLIKLSKILQVKVEYFFRPNSFVMENIQYRHIDKLSKNQKLKIEAQILNQIEQRIELENLLPALPVWKFSPKKLSKIKNLEEIEGIAEKLRFDWDLGLAPISDLINSLEGHGIKVFQYENNLNSAFDGLAACLNNSIYVIVINNHRPGDRQRFTLAHELGHILLADDIANSRHEEKYCDRFAGCFLLPKKSLVQILGEYRTHIEPRELALIKQEFGLSMLSILHRAKDVNIISSATYKRLRAEFDALNWNKEEPGKTYPKESTNNFEQMIFHALAEDLISEAKAAELMNKSLASFRTLRVMRNDSN